jgi:L-aspartate oxidase
VRGEGGYLRNHAGERFMLRYPGAELAPRDVVARGILQEMLRERQDHVWLDLSHLDADLVRGRFPTIAATCAGIGIDITRDLIPVAPAAHYFMGGVAVDCDARTTVRGLWAVGEVACTGVHGANRLASNSLLEGVVFGRRAAEDILRYLTREQSAWSSGSVFEGIALDLEDAISVYRADPGAGPLLQTIMWERAGLYRDAEGLSEAARQIAALTSAEPPSSAEQLPEQFEAGNMLTVAQLIVASALARHESRGGHARSDYPETNPTLAGYRFFIQRDAVQMAEFPLETIHFPALSGEENP